MQFSDNYDNFDDYDGNTNMSELVEIRDDIPLVAITIENIPSLVKYLGNVQVYYRVFAETDVL